MKRKTVLGVNIAKLRGHHSLNEAILGKIPDFKIDEAVDLCTERLGQYIKFYIYQDKSRDPVERNKAIIDAQIVLKELDDEIKELVKNKLFNYSKG
jgi:hypothetical protein